MQVNNQGTIFAFTPETDEERKWIDENVQAEPYQFLGDTLCVEHRCAPALIEGMREAGFEFSDG